MLKYTCALTVWLALSFNVCTGERHVSAKIELLPVVYTQQTNVYICTSKNAYAYHKQNCGALKRCKAGTATLTRADAEQKGYKACKVCKP